MPELLINATHNSSHFPLRHRRRIYSQVSEKLAVALGAGQGREDGRAQAQPACLSCREYHLQDLPVMPRIAHHAALADLAFAHLELRLDEQNRLGLRRQQGDEGG